MNVYYNGILDGVQDRDCDGNLKTNNLYIGRSGDIPSRRFIGIIKNVRIYKRALSPSEITTLYNRVANPPSYTSVSDGTLTRTVNNEIGNPIQSAEITLSGTYTWYAQLTNISTGDIISSSSATWTFNGTTSLPELEFK